MKRGLKGRAQHTTDIAGQAARACMTMQARAYDHGFGATHTFTHTIQDKVHKALRCKAAWAHTLPHVLLVRSMAVRNTRSTASSSTAGTT